MASSVNNSNRTSRVLAGLFMSACVFMFCANEAFAQRGGGGRGGGGGASASRGGGGGGNSGGRTANASVSGGNRASANTNSGNRSSATRSTSNSGNRSVNNSGNRNVNTGNINTGDVNVNRNVNVDVEGGYGCCRNGVRYPVAAAVTVGAIAGTTAAVIAGSYYSALPSNCVTIIRGGISYYQCGSAYYQQSMQGSDVVYMAVDL